MKIPTDNIFKLIHSMSAAEKRYFKRHYASEKSLNTELFDFINNLKAYDEDAVKQHFVKSKVAKNLKVYKVQLTDLILKSLTSYHNKKSIRSKIRMGLEEMEILMDKQLYGLAQKKLKKTKELCERYEEFSLIIPILLAETFLSFFYSTNEDPASHPLTGEFEKYIAILSNTFRLRKINFSLTYKMNNELTHDTNLLEISDFKQELNDILVQSQEKSFSFNELYYLNSSLAKMHSISDGDIEKEYAYKLKTIELFDQFPQVSDSHARLRFAALHSYLECCLRYKKFEELEEGIKKIKDLSGNNPLLDRNLLFVYYLETKYYSTLGKFENLIDQQEEIVLKHIKKYYQEDEQLTALIFIYYVSTYLALNKAQKVQFYLRRLHVISKNFDSSYWQFFDILELISHYETKDYVLIQHAISSIKRKIKKSKKISPFFKIMLDFFQDLIKPNQENKAALAQKIKTATEQYFGDGVCNMLNASLLTDWLDAIIANHSYAEEIKHKQNLL
ncbi:MAG: hypothetical protein AB8G15_04700 [Saprospiraceae bacterium]